MKLIPSFLLVISMSFGLSSCQKNAGTGGNSTIKGSVLTENYNALGTSLISKYNAQDEDVFIVYGGDDAYQVPSAKVATGPDGSFEFKYLAKGKYKLIVYSKCFDPTTCPSGQEALIFPIEITHKKSVIEVPQIIRKN
jgi:hypothetical protein